MVDRISWQNNVVNSSNRMSRSRIVMFGRQDFMAGYCGLTYSSHRMSRSRIVMFGGQDFMAGYCGPDVQLLQDV